MRALVLGGAGYIGSHTVYELIDRGIGVVIADNMETGHREALHPQAAFYEGDIRDAAFLHNLFVREQVDVVIHFAANSLVGESMENPLKYFDNNVNGTRVLLSAMLEHDVKKIVVSSTAAVYGEPEHTPILEEDRTAPRNAYGETKLCMEKMIKWADIANGLKYVSLRYFNACGARKGGNIGEAHRPETHLIPLVLQVANGQRGRIDIFGEDYDTPDGTCLRDYIHVTDLADAHIGAAQYLLAGEDSLVCNLGNGEGYSVKEVVAEAERVTGKSIPVRLAPRRAGDPARLVASSARAKDVLGWEPQYPALEAMIGTAWKWHSTHPYGFGED